MEIEDTHKIADDCFSRECKQEIHFLEHLAGPQLLCERLNLEQIVIHT